MPIAIPGWALFVPIAVFNIVVGLWTIASANRHARYVKAAEARGDEFFAQLRELPDFPGVAAIKKERLRGIVLVLSGIVILMLFYAPVLWR